MDDKASSIALCSYALVEFNGRDKTKSVDDIVKLREMFPNLPLGIGLVFYVNTSIQSAVVLNPSDGSMRNILGHGNTESGEIKYIRDELRGLGEHLSSLDNLIVIGIANKDLLNHEYAEGFLLNQLKTNTCAENPEELFFYSVARQRPSSPTDCTCNYFMRTRVQHVYGVKDVFFSEFWDLAKASAHKSDAQEGVLLHTNENLKTKQKKASPSKFKINPLSVTKAIRRFLYVYKPLVMSLSLVQGNQAAISPMMIATRPTKFSHVGSLGEGRDFSSPTSPVRRLADFYARSVIHPLVHFDFFLPFAFHRNVSDFFTPWWGSDTRYLRDEYRMAEYYSWMVPMVFRHRAVVLNALSASWSISNVRLYFDRRSLSGENQKKSHFFLSSSDDDPLRSRAVQLPQRYRIVGDIASGIDVCQTDALLRGVSPALRGTWVERFVANWRRDGWPYIRGLPWDHVIAGDMNLQWYENNGKSDRGMSAEKEDSFLMKPPCLARKDCFSHQDSSYRYRNGMGRDAFLGDLTDGFQCHHHPWSWGCEEDIPWARDEAFVKWYGKIFSHHVSADEQALYWRMEKVDGVLMMNPYIDAVFFDISSPIYSHANSWIRKHYSDETLFAIWEDVSRHIGELLDDPQSVFVYGPRDRCRLLSPKILARKYLTKFTKAKTNAKSFAI